MRIADPELVNLEILPVGIGQQATDDATVRVACEYTLWLEVFYGKRSVIGAELRRNESVIVLIALVGVLDFHGCPMDS
jgi:hypothetical protein